MVSSAAVIDPPDPSYAFAVENAFHLDRVACVLAEARRASIGIGQLLQSTR